MIDVSAVMISLASAGGLTYTSNSNLKGKHYARAAMQGGLAAFLYALAYAVALGWIQ